MKLSNIAKALVALSSTGINVDAATRNLQDICVCSPRAFSFTLLPGQDCSINTIESNPGISDTSCVIVNVTTANTNTITSMAEDDDAPIILEDVDVSVEEIIGCIPWLDPKNCDPGEDIVEVEDGKKRLLHTEIIGKHRLLQSGSPIPEIITSIQFIELDSEGAVIQIDDSQINIDPPAVSGDTFAFASVSSLLDPAADISSQLDRVPKTAVLFMVGFNEDGDQIRGRFVWEYTNGCGIDEVPIFGDEDFAWASFDQVNPAIGEFCPATSQPVASPTPAPVLIDPFPTAGPMFLTDLPTSFFPTAAPMVLTSLPSTLPPALTPEPTSPPVVPTPPPINNPTPSPSEEAIPTFSPTSTPSKGDGPMPTTKRPTNLMPTTDEPTYFETGKPTFGVPTSPFPTTIYGYGEGNPSYDYDKEYSTSEYVGSSTGSSKDSKSSGSRSGKSGKESYAAKSGKGSSGGGKSGKGGKHSGKGSKTSNMTGKGGKSNLGKSNHGTWRGAESGPKKKRRMLRVSNIESTKQSDSISG